MERDSYGVYGPRNLCHKIKWRNDGHHVDVIAGVVFTPHPTPRHGPVGLKLTVVVPRDCIGDGVDIDFNENLVFVYIRVLGNR